MLRTNHHLKGTVPFMSPEVMLGEHSLVNSEHKESSSTFTHQAVHDMESFFWVLMYICLTRKGPGGARRDELDHEDNPSDHTKELRHIIYCLFDCNWEPLTRNKTRVLTSGNDLEDFILPYFHPYFDDLKDLMRKWRELLCRAHEFHLAECDTIHDQSLRLIEEALDKIRSKVTEEHELTKVELERRKAEMARILKTCRDLSTPSSHAQPLQ